MDTMILGYNIFNKSKSELEKEILSRKKVNIISGNPEVLYNGLGNKELFENFTSKESIIIPDGVGVVLSSKLLKMPVKEKIAGIEVMDDILRSSEKNNKSVYFLGTKEEILNECVKRVKQKYKNLNIAGFHNGFFDLNNCESLIDEIRKSNADVLFVAMGSPRQDIFIQKYKNELPCSIFMAVGGSFDIIAGKLKRAPRWMINMGLEWLYRVSKEPGRIIRLFSIPKFIFKAVYSYYLKSEE